MISLSSKIYKLLKALNAKGYIYLYRRDQVWSYRLHKACSIHQLYRQYTVDEYRQIDKAYKPRKGQRIVRKCIASGYKQIDIVQALMEAWRAAGDGIRDAEDGG